MTDEFYHVPPHKPKAPFLSTDNILDLNDRMDEHLDKLQALAVVINTHENRVNCTQFILHNYFWLMEDEIHQLKRIYEKISAWLQAMG